MLPVERIRPDNTVLFCNTCNHYSRHILYVSAHGGELKIQTPTPWKFFTGHVTESSSTIQTHYKYTDTRGVDRPLVYKLSIGTTILFVAISAVSRAKGLVAWHMVFISNTHARTRGPHALHCITKRYTVWRRRWEEAWSGHRRSRHWPPSGWAPFRRVRSRPPPPVVTGSAAQTHRRDRRRRPYTAAQPVCALRDRRPPPPPPHSYPRSRTRHHTFRRHRGVRNHEKINKKYETNIIFQTPASSF